MYFTPLARTRSATPAFRSHDRSFERFANEALFGRTPDQAKTSMQVVQDEKVWTLTLDLPGLARDELSIGIEGSVIRIASKAEAKRHFKAAYELPQDIDAGASIARLENGVLTLTLAKKIPVSQVTELAIQ